MKAYTPPPDKSVTIRALLLAAIADGSTRIENPLDCEDTRAALRCLEALGLRHCRDGNSVIVEGRGLKGLKRPSGPLCAGESGALARLLAGLMSGQAFPSEITGTGSLLSRPMEKTAAALAKLGARIKTGKGLLPFTINPARLKGGKVSGVDSAQVKSALLLAGLYAAGPVDIKEKFPTRDHTERLLALLGARVTKEGARCGVAPGPLTARPLAVPGDVSSAAPFMAAALLSKEPLRIVSCGLNPTRLGFVDALKKMGARVTVTASVAFPEPAGNIELLPSELKGTSFSPAEIPAMIDEVPLLAVLAGAARGVTVIKGVEGLRGKESDRIESTLALLAALGVTAVYKNGTLTVTGAKGFTALAPVNAFNDHRIAMAAAAAGTACPGLKITDRDCVAKSYPGFWKDFRKVFK
ncbi:MAG: 3-phosphoshikimate 1-carboxyvinyltransferase [Elusimicrobia bacterium GWC2_64_44]|nr:MAG: 3-phosphoshikimate 1-carboxyvinyltransferase [Elusimicrobia bacterium GWC2_64_44]